MRNWIAAFGLLAVFLSALLALPAQAAPSVVGVDTLLRSETDLSQMPKLRDWTAHMQSSYDRTGGNGDAQNFLAMNGTTATLADMDGPGAVVRIWSANANGQLKIYIDDNPTPVIDMPFAKLFDGTLPAFAAPLVQTSTGGFYSYLPIPYAKHCRITVDNPQGLYYHVNYLTFAPNTTVRPFALPLTADEQTALQAAVHAWQLPGAALASQDVSYSPRRLTVDAGKTQTVEEERGPGVIRYLELVAPPSADLRRLILRCYFDGHQTPDIEAPVADFFGNGYGRKPFTSVFLSQTETGAMEARFPMPFGRSARFTLENGMHSSVGIVWNVGMTREAFQPAEDGYFHAQWFQEVTKRGVPHVWTKVSGQRGHFVGIVQTMAGGRGLGYLEGDEQFRVDDQVWGASKVPTTVIGPWNGTGTEDCFNSGWYFDKGPNALPVNGALVRDEAHKLARINAYRWFLNDAPVFQQSIDAQIEHGGANDAPDNDYSSVAYWYATGQTQPWSPMPPASQIEPPHSLIPAPALVLKNAVEGESLLPTAKATGGKLQEQDMSPFPGAWSNDDQLWWTDGKVGDTLTLMLPAHPGTFDLLGYFTRAGDYGQVTFTLNGQPVGGVYDAYHAGVVPSGPVPLGRVTLPDGPASFVVTIHGKNAAATNTLFGLDALVLKPVK